MCSMCFNVSSTVNTLPLAIPEYISSALLLKTYIKQQVGSIETWIEQENTALISCSSIYVILVVAKHGEM